MNDNTKHYNSDSKPIAHAIVKIIGDEGITLAEAEGQVTSEALHATVVGYLAGFETALHVAICTQGEDLVKVLAMSMDMDIHEGATDFHDIAEELIGNIKITMLQALVAQQGGALIEVTGDSAEEAQIKVAEVIARMMPTKARSDA